MRFWIRILSRFLLLLLISISLFHDGAGPWTRHKIWLPGTDLSHKLLLLSKLHSTIQFARAEKKCSEQIMPRRNEACLTQFFLIGGITRCIWEDAAANRQQRKQQTRGESYSFEWTFDRSPLLLAKPDREGCKQCEQCKVVQRQKSASLHLLGISLPAALLLKLKNCFKLLIMYHI